MFAVKLFENTKNDLIKSIFYIYFINCLIIILEAYVGKPFFYQSEILGNLSYRYKGYSMIGGSSLSFINFLVLLQYWKRFTSDFLFKIIITFIFILATLFVGRFGLICMLLFLLYQLFLKFKYLSLPIISFTLYLIYFLVNKLKKLHLRGMEIFENLFLNGNIETSSSITWVIQIQRYINKFKFSFIGNGNYGFRDSHYSLPIDSAYLLIYNGGGLIILLLYILFILKYKYLKETKFYFLLFNFKELLLANPLIFLFGIEDDRKT